MNDTIEAAASVDPAELAAALVQEHVDIVERLNAEPLERASAVLSAMPLDRAAEVLDEPGLEAAADLVEAQPPGRAVRLSQGPVFRSTSGYFSAPWCPGPRASPLTARS